MTTTVEARSLTRRFGRLTALDGVDLDARAGSAHGIVGPPGAGKTTLLRILGALLAPTSGQARVGGWSVVEQPAAVRSITGYAPSEFGVYRHMSAAEYVAFFAGCHGVPEDERGPLVDDLLELVDLAHRRDTAVDELSLSMRKRLGLARALAHDPRVLLLDDPLTGLDPRGRVEIRELIRELRAMGKTLLITSRNVGELEGVCDWLTLIERGRASITGDFGAITKRLRPHRPIVITFLGEADAALEVARSNPGAFNARMMPRLSESGGLPPLVSEMRLNFDGSYAEASSLLADLLRAGMQVVSFAERAETLDDLFEKVDDGNV